MAHGLVNKLTAKPGKREQVVQILIESERIFDDNPACQMYLVTESTEDPEVIWVIDLWSNAEEHSEALKAPELKPFVQEAMGLLEGVPEQIAVHPVGGKAPQL